MPKDEYQEMSFLRVTSYYFNMLPVLKPGVRSFFVFPLIIFALLTPLVCHAAPSGVLILSSGKSPVYEKIAEALKARLKSPERRVHLLTYSNKHETSLVIPSNTQLVITLGLKAGEVIQTMNSGLPVLHALIPKSSSSRLLKNTENRTAIYLDQAPNRQLLLAQLINKDPHIGILLGNSTMGSKQEFISLANKLGMEISYRAVTSEEMVGPQLKELLVESNILLALPDPSVFNRRTVFNILLSSYHNKTPVIGFSSAYVKAGALISIFSTPDDIARHIAETTSEYLEKNEKKLPKPEYPKYFSVEINSSVARSLGITLPSESEIIKFITNRTSQ
ncbi:MAG: hypothetical protein OQK19_04400 [Sedimenticola sp.]|nr:hypothetical protein [Sedimenticola sp.]